jgi:hypothetical protein
MRNLAGSAALLRMLAVGGAAVIALPAASQPVVIDVEQFSGMNYNSGQPIPEFARLSDELAATDGVLFSSGAGYVAVVALGIGHATSGINGIGGSTPDGILTYDRQWPVVFRFVDPQNPAAPAVTDFVSVRGDLWANSGMVVVLNAYDVGGTLIASDQAYDSGGETLIVAAPGIHRVEFLGTHDWCGVALDDLSFDPVTPSPTAVAPQTWSMLKVLYR